MPGSNLFKSCYICAMLSAMARGQSGRIVVEVDPEFKDQLYVALARARLTLKKWFIREGSRFLQQQGQLKLFSEENSVADDEVREKG